MHVDVVMPKMGESIQEGKILRWLKKPGDKVERDETILEISTDKVDSEIPSPASGVITKILISEQETVDVGTLIAVIETDASAATIEASGPTTSSSQQSTQQTTTRIPQSTDVVTSTETKEGRDRNSERFYSPLVRTIAKKEGLAQTELEALRGSGVGGRVTKQDVLAYLKTRQAGGSVAPQGIETRLTPVDEQEILKKYPPPLYKVVQMDNIQQRMAEHMVRSVKTSPHVEAISECDVTRIADYRTKHADRFMKQEGFKLTFTHFFLDAIVRALKEFSLVNSSLEGDKIVMKNFIHLGMAVASPGGLIVPVIKHAEKKNFLDLARSINDLAARARNKKLAPDDIQGGTFTVTNYGVFDTLIGTPIISQPQLAILGIGAIKKRPVIVTDEEGSDAIAVRSMSYLTLTFDHRIIDGDLGGKFLAKVIAHIERFDFANLF